MKNQLMQAIITEDQLRIHAIGSHSRSGLAALVVYRVLRLMEDRSTIEVDQHGHERISNDILSYLPHPNLE